MFYTLPTRNSTPFPPLLPESSSHVTHILVTPRFPRVLPTSFENDERVRKENTLDSSRPRTILLDHHSRSPSPAHLNHPNLRD